MTSPYLVEVRTGGETKTELRRIIDDVANEFAVHDSTASHTVPHIPLFGRYDTDQGQDVKRTLVETLSGFDVVPYRISGFGVLDGRSVYIDVVPSLDLVALRRQINENLRPLTFDNSWRDETDPYEFHIPVIDSEDANADAGRILDYLENRYDPNIDEYATRITNLSGTEMLWEYDLLQGRVLEHREATSRESWQQTKALLDERSDRTDHKSLVSERVGNVIQAARERGWRYFDEPHDHVTDRARKDGLYQIDGDAPKRELYFGDNYAYLVIAGRNTGVIHTLSLHKSDFYDDTVGVECPICQTSMRQYENGKLLPCHDCGLQYELREDAPNRETVASSSTAAKCVRCNRPVLTGGVQFEEYVYCDSCVDEFERVADRGIVVRSRHGESDYDEIPYVVQWDGKTEIADSQVEALARGKELAAKNGVPGLFIYRRHGSHWLIDTYLDAHPKLKSRVEKECRKIRGEDRVQIDDEIETENEADRDVTGHDIRAGGDVFIAENAIKDAVVNRTDIGDDTADDT